MFWIFFLRIIYPPLSSEFQIPPRILLPLTGSCFTTYKSNVFLPEVVWHLISTLIILSCSEPPMPWSFILYSTGLNLEFGYCINWNGIWKKFIFYKWLAFIWKYWHNNVNFKKRFWRPIMYEQTLSQRKIKSSFCKYCFDLELT